MEPQFDYLLDVTPDVYEAIMGMGDSLPEDHYSDPEEIELTERIAERKI